MDELFAELKECTCIVQGREATAQQIIEKHVAKLFETGGDPLFTAMTLGGGTPVVANIGAPVGVLVAHPETIAEIETRGVQVVPSAQDLDAVAAEHKAADDTAGQ